jgi:hypothetical protein
MEGASSESLKRKDSGAGSAAVRPASSDPQPGDLGFVQPSTTRWRRLFNWLASKDGWLGDYDYAALLIPSIPFLKKRQRLLPFFGVNERIPVVLAFLLGLQHALAMVGGIITPPLLLGGSAGLALDPSAQQYLLSASLIWCSIATAIQISRIGPVRGYYWGTASPLDPDVRVWQFLTISCF